MQVAGVTSPPYKPSLGHLVDIEFCVCDSVCVRVQNLRGVAGYRLLGKVRVDPFTGQPAITLDA